MRLISALLTLAAVGFTTANYANTTTIITPPPSPPVTACPTVTSTTNLCRTCAVPLCLVLSTLTQHCKCPNDPVTAFTSHPCELQCKGIGCATSYTIVTEKGCSTSKSSSKSSKSSYSHSHSHSDDICPDETEHPVYTKTYTHTDKPYPPKHTHKEGPPPGHITTKGPTKAPTATPPPPKTTPVTAGASRRMRAPFRFW
ncbi:hypothetical protein B0T16DRAFT_496449 [Cercophora newfieldiana]|uniref:Uncharacterized protein n=1 Tax=Cercophora newfieldiana TaxID=92897 RepID=A0AA39XXY6_9PEZI|nr:hypothetical protein B0T16DRAFT_496449 [Cercophora newfieldiana]